MSRNINNDQESSRILSNWKERRKPFLYVEVILALLATILAIINLIRWNTDLPLISLFIFLLVGIVFILKGIESRLNKEKEYKLTISLGTLTCIIAIISFIV